METTLKLHALKTQSADAGVQREAPIAVELSQFSPSTFIEYSEYLECQSTGTFPTVSRVPQRKAMLNPPPSTWLWPVIIMLSALVVGFVTFMTPNTVVRPIVVMWFLFVCPGMVTVRFLRLEKQVVEWTLAIALSFAIDAIVAGLVLYAGRWSPPAILSILIGLCLGGAIVQFPNLHFTATLFAFKTSHPKSW